MIDYKVIKEWFSETKNLMLVNGYSALSLNAVEKALDNAITFIPHNCETCKFDNNCDCCQWIWNGERR